MGARSPDKPPGKLRRRLNNRQKDSRGLRATGEVRSGKWGIPAQTNQIEVIYQSTLATDTGWIVGERSPTPHVACGIIQPE